MDKIRSVIIAVYRLSTIFTLGFITWKIVRHRRNGFAIKSGRAIDASIGAVAEKLEKTAIALEVLRENGIGENLGKSLEEVLTDTKKTIEETIYLVKRELQSGS